MRFVVLDSWRGVAALAVALFHLTIAGHFFELYMIRNGKYFVDFFFVLSGFVIAHSYQGYVGREQAEYFLIKRFARIAPLHYFTLFIFILIELVKFILVVVLGIRSGEPPFSGQTSIPAIGANLLLLQGMNIFDGWTWNIPSWSISAEFYAYATFAILIAIVTNRRDAMITMICVASGAWLFSSVIEGTYTDQRLAFIRCVFEFFAGMIVYRLYLLNDGKIEAGKFEVPLLIVIGVLLSFCEKRQLIFMVPFLFSGAVFVFAHEQGIVSKFLRLKALQHLGRISFSIYMTHFVILTLLTSGTRVLEQLLHSPLREIIVFRGEKFDLMTAGGPWLLDILALVYIIVVVIVSNYTYYNIEMPSQKYIQNLGLRLFGRLSTSVR